MTLTQTTLDQITARAKAHGGYVYLASPYSHPDPYLPLGRALAATQFAVLLMRRGVPVYAPIPFSHQIATDFDLPTDWAFWKRQDTPLVLGSKEVVVLSLPGWDESVGVADEIEMAREAGIPAYLW